MHKYQLEVTFKIYETDQYNKPLRDSATITQSKSVTCHNFGEIGDILQQIDKVGINK